VADKHSLQEPVAVDAKDAGKTRQVEGKFQLTVEQYNAIKDEYPDLDTRVIGVPGIGKVVIIPPAAGDQRRFRQKIDPKARGTRSDALEELARVSVVWPSVQELDREIERRRKGLAWPEIGSHAAELAGFSTEQLEGN